MIAWTRPEYLNLDWSDPNALPTPHVRVPLEEALAAEFCWGEVLDGICFSGVYIDGHYETVHYRFYDSRAYAVCRRYYPEQCGDGDLVIGDYCLGAYRIGCTHPNMTDGWSSMHTRVRECPDCGYKATFDTSG